jgi:hypothetical protein
MTFMDQDVAHFVIDARASLFTAQAFAAGMISVVAHSPKFAIWDIVGDITFVPGTMVKASIRLTIDVGSLEIMDEVTSVVRRWHAEGQDELKCSYFIVGRRKA